MTLDTRDKFDRLPSIGIDATDLSRYADVQASEGEIVIYDKYEADGWVQSDAWIDAEEMR